MRAVAVSPDGVNVAVGEERGLLSLRDLDRGSVRWEIQAHRYALDSVAFSPDGSRVVTTCGVGVGLPPEDVPEPGVGAVRVEKYSRTLLWEIGEVKAWDLGTGAPQWSHSEGRPLFTYGVAWSPDGTRIATAGNELRLWDGETGERQRTVAGDPLLLAMDVAFSPEGKYLVTVGPDPDQGSSGGALRLWDVETGAALQTVAEGETLSLGNTVAWSPRGDLIGCGGYGHMRRGALSLWRFG